MSQPQEAQGVQRFADTPNELEAYMAAQRIEYSKYVAAEHIYDGLALAYPMGHPVSTETAERLGWDKDGKVRLSDAYQAASAAVAKNQPASPAPKGEGK